MNTVSQIPQSAPSFLENMQLLKNNIFASLNCHLPGKIIAFDAETQTCTVQIMPLKYETLAPAPITQVPLIMLGAGGGHITLPNPVGTTCLLLFIDRNIDAFLETGEAYAPTTSRMHDFTDCVALTTFKTLVDPIEDYDVDAITLINEKIIEEVKNQSYLKVYGNSVQIKTMQGEATSAAINVTDKINIENTTQNLATLMQSFLTICKSLRVDTNTGLVTTEAQQQFEELQKKFNQLLN